MSERAIRVATWNVHGLRGGVAAVAEVVEAEEVDILLVQESGPRRRLAALGRALGMTVLADPRAFPRRRVHDAVLVRSGHEVRRHELIRFGSGPFLQPRGALVARLADPLIAVSVHLGLRGPERGRQIGELVSFLEGAADGFVLGGDLNVLPEQAGPARLAGVATDCWVAAGEGPGPTFPSTDPTARIDYLFVGHAVQALRARTAGATASDHLMVVADLRVGR
ncbi:MAG: endonuclease/exonuclease/phosphatase family protein [Actinomycetota bacterium]